MDGPRQLKYRFDWANMTPEQREAVKASGLHWTTVPVEVDMTDTKLFTTPEAILAESEQGVNDWKHSCGAILLSAQVNHPVHDGPFPLSGSGEVQTQQVPYCPDCHAPPSPQGAPVRPGDQKWPPVRVPVKAVPARAQRPSTPCPDCGGDRDLHFRRLTAETEAFELVRHETAAWCSPCRTWTPCPDDAVNWEKRTGWIGVDLDGTLAHWPDVRAEDADLTWIGEPIPAMLDRVKAWLSEGRDVRIVTARVNPRSRWTDSPTDRADRATAAIHDWCLRHLGRTIPVQYDKDSYMFELWDDRAVCVEKNTGRVIGHHGREWSP